MAPLFESLLVETSNTCTRKCWFCKFGLERQDPSKEKMSWELIERIVHNLKDLDYRGRLSWFWINEPLADRRMNDIIAFSREQLPNAFLSLLTNGDLLSDSRYEDLRHAGLDALGVSVYDDATLEKLLEMQGDRYLVPLDMRRPDGKLQNRAGSIENESGRFDGQLEVYRDRGCAHPSKMMAINPQGQVALCCSDMYTDVLMGDVNEERLEAIWENEKFTHYRQTLESEGRASLPLCQNCTDSGAGPSSRAPLPANCTELPDGTETPDSPSWFRSLLDRQFEQIQAQEYQLLEKEIVIQKQHRELVRLHEEEQARKKAEEERRSAESSTEEASSTSKDVPRSASPATP